MNADSPAAGYREILLQRLVAAFNSCARSGDFAPCSDLFADDAVMEFEGVPDWGPFEGKAAIIRRLSSEPPDDELQIRNWRDDGRSIHAQFIWRDLPEALGGALVLQGKDAKITHLIVAFGGPDVR
ncbi:MAG TPA: nuclear transport factor 2 family protein [Candidatus Baltobacteraceae bacterium]|jgi:hypothetical protein|nr:nuclear transport factor 2 family protein [Candidatus Baltobacteraceae bacterium]